MKSLSDLGDTNRVMHGELKVPGKEGDELGKEAGSDEEARKTVCLAWEVSPNEEEWGIR